MSFSFLYLIHIIINGGHVLRRTFDIELQKIILYFEIQQYYTLIGHICWECDGYKISWLAFLFLQNKSRLSGDCTPNSGSGSCPRNQHSIPESINAIPSVGSPGSIGMSPHPNSTLSQPTSVPPVDQVCIVHFRSNHV